MGGRGGDGRGEWREGEGGGKRGEEGGGEGEWAEGRRRRGGEGRGEEPGRERWAGREGDECCSAKSVHTLSSNRATCTKEETCSVDPERATARLGLLVLILTNWGTQRNKPYCIGVSSTYSVSN